MRVDAPGQVDAGHFRPVLPVFQYPLAWHLAGLENILAVVDVVQKGVQRLGALAQAVGDVPPFRRGNDVRQHVERDQPLGTGLLAVHGKGDADSVEQQVRSLAHLLDVLGRRAGDPFGKRQVMAAHAAVRQVHLVIVRVERHDGAIHRCYSATAVPIRMRLHDAG